jgi:hypothetical protein
MQNPCRTQSECESRRRVKKLMPQPSAAEFICYLHLDCLRGVN